MIPILDNDIPRARRRKCEQFRYIPHDDHSLHRAKAKAQQAVNRAKHRIAAGLPQPVPKQLHNGIGYQQQNGESQYSRAAAIADIGFHHPGQRGVEIMDCEQGDNPSRQGQNFLNEAAHEAGDRAKADQNENRDVEACHDGVETMRHRQSGQRDLAAAKAR